MTAQEPKTQAVPWSQLAIYAVVLIDMVALLLMLIMLHEVDQIRSGSLLHP